MQQCKKHVQVQRQSRLGDMDPSPPDLAGITPQLQHLEPDTLLATRVDVEAVRQQSLDHVVDVSFGAWVTLSMQVQGHIEYYIARALMSQLELDVVVLG